MTSQEPEEPSLRRQDCFFQHALQGLHLSSPAPGEAQGGLLISRSPSHLHLEHSHPRIPQGRDQLCKIYDSLQMHEALEEPRSLWEFPGEAGSRVDVPLLRHARHRCRLSGAAAWQPVRQPRNRRFPGRVGVRTNNDCAAALGSGTTGSQHRNYSRHKENTNKDHTQQREAGISQQKRRMETLKAAFISLCSSVRGQSSTRNVRARGTPQVTRISSFIAYFLYKLTTNTGVLILFVLFGNSETE